MEGPFYIVFVWDREGNEWRVPRTWDTAVDAIKTAEDLTKYGYAEAVVLCCTEVARFGGQGADDATA